MSNFRADISRRESLRLSGLGLAASSLLPTSLRAVANSNNPAQLKSIRPKAKRVIYLSMLGGPSQLDLFDHKPKLQERAGEDINNHLKAQKYRFPAMTADQAQKQITPSPFKFSQHGDSATWLSELLPHTAKIVDDLAIIKSMSHDVIDHDSAQQICHTGSPQLGQPSFGAWLSYALGSQNEKLPNFAVLHARNTAESKVSSLSPRLWGPGFLSQNHAGMLLHPKGDPTAYLHDLPGIDRELRRQMLDSLNQLNQKSLEEVGSKQIEARMQQYERAYHMQDSITELHNLSSESPKAREIYGPQADTPGSFAHSCLMARRMVERGVQFIQIFHRGWDHHQELPTHLKSQCQDIDQASWALIADLKQRGLLDDTLIVWGGEFGRSVYAQGPSDQTNFGRDHQAQAFTMWMAGGGIKGGQTYGETDELGSSIVEKPVSFRDLHATILHQLGVDHSQLSVTHHGRKRQLTGHQPAKILSELLS